MTPEEAGRAFVDPSAYTDTRFQEAAALLRREAPVHYIDEPGYLPFWAVTRHADIAAIERNSSNFLSAPRALLQAAEVDLVWQKKGPPVRSIIMMDAPDHRVYRAIGSEWFKPRRLAALEEDVRSLARRTIRQMGELGGLCDFVQVAADFPLYVILSILGLPEADFPMLLKLSNETTGGNDPELRRSADADALEQVFRDFFKYSAALTVDRRATPTDDLASALANARVDGNLLPDTELFSYYTAIAVAGHETTRATMTGGLLALIESPDEFARLKADPALMTTGADEMVRWASPVKEFMRTAATDVVVGGVEIKAGQAVYLAYESANRDESVFEEPYRFDLSRHPNPHLGFGIGPHFCMGAQLARMELQIFFAEFMRAIESVELAGSPAFAATLQTGGLKHLPISYKMVS